MTRPASSVALPALRQRRSLAEIKDSELAQLIRLRLRLMKKRGKSAFAIFATALCATTLGSFFGPTDLILSASGTAVACLALGLSYFVDRALWWRFSREGKLYGLDEDLIRYVYERAPRAEDVVETLLAMGDSLDDESLARFVRA